MNQTTGQNSKQSQSMHGKAKCKTTTKDELYKNMKSGENVQIVNVLDPKYYDLGMIKGSKKIPLDQLESRMSELDKSRPVVTYCVGRECDASTSAAEKLTAKGFDASAYEGGIKEWKEAGLPNEA